ncbi:leucine-rich repeat and guanylate kinase domain-containing protein [Pogoniulus pusillus]|uniref:leucine-rich repeat and guanylate kinase domain-containing protein n=1 Tax=Pogoniulus pusillus TaxID=488313 RepID=UPI0030B96D25
MAGADQQAPTHGPGELLLPSQGLPQHLSEGVPEELPQDEPSLQQPQLTLPYHGDEEDEDEDEEVSDRIEDHFDGVLKEDMVAEGLHELGRSAPGIEYVYLHLSLAGRELSDINILSKYIHLQKLEIPSNKINDLSCVSHMPYLLELNASNNELTTYFSFQPPKSLKEVDFSCNQIPKMQDLSAYQSLTKLLLDFNNIEEIRGLEKCHSLTHLSLSHNRLVAISGLEHLPIRILNLNSNQIEAITGLGSLKTLQKLDLSRNKITSLHGLEEHDLLEVINLEDNQVAELHELECIEELPLLRVLNLLRNPLQEQADYWLLAIFTLLRLTELDGRKISVEEKVAAVNKYDPPPEVVAARDHMTQVMYSMLQPQRILDSTLPSLDAAYPMLVLVGPLACGKRELTHKICRQFNNFFRYGPCHTTRAAYFGEENRLDYYFISQEAFDQMVNTGKFIATYKYSGYCYGLGRETVESVAREGLATCVHLEAEGARSLKNTYFKPRYILLVPMNKEKYEGHLRRKGLFSRPEIEEAVSRVDMYIKMSQEIPGFFDAVVNTDDMEEAFTELSFLIKAFLGLEPPADSDSTQELHIRARAGSGIRFLQEQRLSPAGATTGTTEPSPANEFLESSAKIYPGDTFDKLAEQLSSVEEASFRRRRAALRQALAGKAPTVYLQLFQSSRESGLATGQLLTSPGASAAERLTVGTPIPHGHLAEEAKAEQQDARGAGSGADRQKETDLTSDTLQRQPSKSKAAPPHLPQLISWPGSHSRPVLPPIPPGRKKTNP